MAHVLPIIWRIYPLWRVGGFLRENQSMTAADVLRVGLDQAQPAIEEAFNLGYGDAEWRLKVTYRCSAGPRDPNDEL
jgi:hypothetical protein